ncbi:MAG: ABC transporter permease, partial [Leucobacter sp.]
MLIFILKRLLFGVVLLFVVASGTFFLTHIAIPNPALNLLGSGGATPEAVAALTAKIGTDRPVLVQYQEWLASILQLDFGTSWKNGQPVGKTLAIRLPV